MYLFIFAVLYILFQYVSSKNFFQENEAKIQKLEQQVTQLTDSVGTLNEKILDLGSFNLANDDLGLEYFAEYGYEQVIPFIEDKLIETNLGKGNNPLVPYEMTGETPFKINSMRVLNHRWVVADFSDGKQWGQVIVKYFINEDNTMDFEVVEHLLYPN